MKFLLVLASFGILASAQYPDALGAPGTSYGAPSQARSATEFHSSSTVPFQGGYPGGAPAGRGPAEYLPPQSNPVLYSMPVVQQQQFSSSPSAPSGGYPPGSADRASSGGYPSSAARAPAPSGGYSQAQSSPQYNPPSAKYGAPQPQYSAPAAPQYDAQSAPQYSAPGSQYGAPQSAVQSAPQYSAPGSQYGAPQSAAQSAPQYSAPGSQYGAPGAGDDRASQGYPTESDTKISGGAGGAGDERGGPVQQVHKHVYVHVAPDEEPEPKEEKSPKAPLIPEKHYKILFIKAPTPPPYEAPEIPEAQPAPETKTLVYVLLKKPDPTPALQLAAVPATKPSKPEVYFIRYKSPEGEAKSSPEAGSPNGQGQDGGANNGLDDGRAQGGYSNSASSGGPGQYGPPN